MIFRHEREVSLEKIDKKYYKLNLDNIFFEAKNEEQIIATITKNINAFLKDKDKKYIEINLKESYKALREEVKNLAHRNFLQLISNDSITAENLIYES